MGSSSFPEPVTLKPEKPLRRTSSVLLLTPSSSISSLLLLLSTFSFLWVLGLGLLCLTHYCLLVPDFPSFGSNIDDLSHLLAFGVPPSSKNSRCSHWTGLCPQSLSPRKSRFGLQKEKDVFANRGSPGLNRSGSFFDSILLRKLSRCCRCFAGIFYSTVFTIHLSRL